MRVGLTGSIATGKSFVSSVLKELGAHVIDADLLARKVVEPGTAGLQAIVNRFGSDVLRVDGSLDRAKLAHLVFADAAKRETLNAILHPLIFVEQDEWLNRQEAEDPNAIAVVDASLMIESGGYKRFDKLVVVHCRPEVQLERLMVRDKLSREEALKRIGSQMPQEEKLAYADFRIDTSAGFADTRHQTEKLYEQLKALAVSKK
jgi:dephospho-CoA kinase